MDTKQVLLEKIGWTEEQFFWFNFNTAECYLMNFEKLNQTDANMIMSLPDFWNWWNALFMNATDLFLMTRKNEASSFTYQVHISIWSEGKSLHRSFWDSNYELMISKLIKNATHA